MVTRSPKKLGLFFTPYGYLEYCILNGSVDLVILFKQLRHVTSLTIFVWGKSVPLFPNCLHSGPV